MAIENLFIWALIVSISPAVIYYLIVEKKIQKSILFLAVFIGISKLLQAVILLLNINLPNSDQLTNIFIFGAILTSINTLLSYYLIHNKIEFKTIAKLTGFILLISWIFIFLAGIANISNIADSLLF